MIYYLLGAITAGFLLACFVDLSKVERLMKPVQSVILIAVLFAIGLRVGTDESIVRDLPVMGGQALGLAAAGLVGSVAAVVIVLRSKGTAAAAADRAELRIQNRAALGASLRCVLCLAAGIGAGAGAMLLGFGAVTASVSDTAALVLLVALLFVVGTDLAQNRASVWTAVKTGGWRMLLIPLLTGRAAYWRRSSSDG